MIEEDELPEDWKVKNLGEVANFQNGKYLPKKDMIEEGEHPVYGSNGLLGYYDDYWVEDNSAILIGRVGSCGEINTVGENCWATDNSIVMWTGDDIMSQFAEYYLVSFDFNPLIREASQPLIRQGDVKDISIPVPPLDEQERIVEAVGERLERVERLETSVANVGRLADEYEDSLLSYLLTGRNIGKEEISEDEEWFGQIPDDWNVKKLNDIGSRVSSMTEPESGTKYSLYSFDSVDDGSGYYEVYGEDIGSRKRELNGGEVMISRLNPRINRVQIVDEEHEYPPIASSEFVAIDVEDSINREYLYEYLRNPILQDRLTNNVTGATGSRTRVGFDFVMESRIPVPPREKQEEIVSNLRNIDFSLLQKSRSDISSLFSEYRASVLSHAFRGKIDY